jgi:hypothetical protein
LVDSISEEVTGSIYGVQVLLVIGYKHYGEIYWFYLTIITGTVPSPSWQKPTLINDDDSDIDVRKIDCSNGPLWPINLSAFAVVL